MSDDKKSKVVTFKVLLTAFWVLSRPRQEALLKNLYELSPENKALLRLRLSDQSEKVFADLKLAIAKETVKRIGRFRKIRFAELNKLLRQADKMALPMHQQIELKHEVWLGVLEFILSKQHVPERYLTACARHLDEYLQMVDHHILERSEVEERHKEVQVFLQELFRARHYLPALEDVYLKWFKST